MSTQLIAILASAGLLTAGVATVSETRSTSAIPSAKLVAAAKARTAPGIATARQAGRPDCTIAENASLPACANPGTGPGASASGGGGVSGAVLGALAAGAIGVGVAVAAKNDSNG